MNGRRRLSKSELDDWRRATADVKPLAEIEAETRAERPAPGPGMKPRAPTTSSAATKKAVVGKTTARPKPSRPGIALDPKGPVDIDRRSWARLKRGQVAIERKLDLHGRTQTEAHDALDRFLTMAAATGLRCVLVVTGKGGVGARGVLRQMVPRWLDEPGNRDKVLTYAPAQPRHGGDGALYVLLRRRRPGPAR